jgi:hypothetical protein
MQTTTGQLSITVVGPSEVFLLSCEIWRQPENRPQGLLFLQLFHVTFNTHLDSEGLRVEFELMAEEIKALLKERANAKRQQKMR